MPQRLLPLFATVLLFLLVPARAGENHVQVETVTIPVAKLRDLGLDWAFYQKVQLNPMSGNGPEVLPFEADRPVRGTFTAPQFAAVRRALIAEELAPRPLTSAGSSGLFEIPCMDKDGPYTLSIDAAPETDRQVQIKIFARDPASPQEATIPADATLVLSRLSQTPDAVDVFFVKPTPTP